MFYIINQHFHFTKRFLVHILLMMPKKNGRDVSLELYLCVLRLGCIQGLLQINILAVAHLLSVLFNKILVEVYHVLVCIS